MLHGWIEYSIMRIASVCEESHGGAHQTSSYVDGNVFWGLNVDSKGDHTRK